MMHFINVYEEFNNGYISYDTFINKIKNSYLKNSLAKEYPDEHMILSSILIIILYNKYNERNEMNNMIALASRILIETGDKDAVLLLLSFIPVQLCYLRRIIRTYKHNCLIPFLSLHVNLID
jgi:hypothetical protein